MAHLIEAIQETRDSQLESSTHNLIIDFVNENRIFALGGFIPVRLQKIELK